jgi:transposase
MDAYLGVSREEGYAGRIEVLGGPTGRRQRSDAEKARISAHSAYVQPVPAILPSGDFRPGHLFPSNLANPKESQPAEITQLLFQSASYGRAVRSASNNMSICNF